MDSQKTILKALLQTGVSFSFQNFCLPHKTDPGLFGGPDTPEWGTFKTRVKNTITKLMDDNSPATALMKQGVAERTEGYYEDKFILAQQNLVEALRLTLSSLENDTFGELRSSRSESAIPQFSNKVFIVHGHDQGFKTDTERFIHELGLEPVVLHRAVDQGTTIIEKFENNSDVGFVFVLLTPDEIAYTVDQLQVEEAQRATEYRARPNVIFEFGYFVGKLGRSRVCCLLKGDVSVPSDISGVIYKKIDSSIDTQAYAIIRELKAAGYNLTV